MSSPKSSKSRTGLGFASVFGEASVFVELLSFTVYGILHRALPSKRCRGRGVVLIPGFLAGDVSLVPLGSRLRELGYQVFFSGIWCNVDCPLHTMARLEKVLRKANRMTNAKVTLIGHSLGGIYARELSEKFPELVERAILLGSPIKDPIGNSSVVLRWLAEFLHSRCPGRVGPSKAPAVDLSPEPPRVPETVIYSKADGVVQWQSCIEAGPQVEAIEVPSSHCGLPYSPETFEIVAARLEQCSDQEPSMRGRRSKAN